MSLNRSAVVKCQFSDDRVDFFATLGEKLGSDFELTPLESGDLENLAGEVLLVGIPALSSPEFAERMEKVQDLALNPAGIPVVAFVASSERKLVRDVMSAGAYDCIVETASMQEFQIVLRRAANFYSLNCEVSRLRTNETSGQLGFVVGSSTKMEAIHHLASRVASSDATMLILGETGTGKEYLARAIHDASPRAKAPFVAVACSSLPEGLIEAELFGHEKGAFTGAVAARRGRFEAAEYGTIFLDEIGELSPSLQVKLLRVLQERTFERLGSNQPRQLRARVICATNRQLGELVKAGLFRPDLYYRLNTVEIEMPPLRERRDDIVVLAHMFLNNYADHHRRQARRISPVAVAALKRHSWPGNIRELQHVIERAVLVSDGPEITLEHLSPELRTKSEAIAEMGSFDNEVREFKRRLIEKALLQSGNNKVHTARLLGISRSSLHRLIDELDIDCVLSSKAAA